MGITTNDFFENIYKVIFSPKKFFFCEDSVVSVRLAVAIIAFISGFNYLIFAIAKENIHNTFLIFNLILSIFGAIIIWFLTALFFEYIAKIFDRGNKLSSILYFTAFAPLPYLFFAPLNLLKNIGDIGYIIASNLEIILYFWIIILYAFSISGVYKISLSRSFMLIFLPFLSSFFALWWLIGFFNKIWYIFSV